MTRARPALTAALAVLLTLMVACSSPAASPSGGGGTSGGAATIEARTIGSGPVLVASSNGMTVYTFTKDTVGSGTSACTGDCLTTWPALTVPSGAAPAAGSGATGRLGTITRADTGALQVTYNGLPLYFFSGDKAPGDLNGVYTNWKSGTP